MQVNKQENQKMDFPNIQRNDLIGQVKITALLGQTFLSDL
jgi:hypothetical protein